MSTNRVQFTCMHREGDRDRQTDTQAHTHTRHSIITTWLTIFRSPRNRYVVEWWCMFFDIQFTTWMRQSLSLCIAFGCSFGLMSLHDSSIHFYFTRFFARCLLCLFLPCSCLLFLLLFSSINFLSLACVLWSSRDRGRESAVVILSFSVESSRWFCFSHCFADTCEYQVFVCAIGCKMIKYKYRYIRNQTITTTTNCMQFNLMCTSAWKRITRRHTEHIQCS